MSRAVQILICLYLFEIGTADIVKNHPDQTTKGLINHVWTIKRYWEENASKSGWPTIGEFTYHALLISTEGNLFFIIEYPPPSMIDEKERRETKRTLVKNVELAHMGEENDYLIIDGIHWLKEVEGKEYGGQFTVRKAMDTMKELMEDFQINGLEFYSRVEFPAVAVSRLRKYLGL
jgi:hypothetical protein